MINPYSTNPLYPSSASSTPVTPAIPALPTAYDAQMAAAQSSQILYNQQQLYNSYAALAVQQNYGVPYLLPYHFPPYASQTIQQSYNSEPGLSIPAHSPTFLSDAQGIQYAPNSPQQNDVTEQGDELEQQELTQPESCESASSTNANIHLQLQQLKGLCLFEQQSILGMHALCKNNEETNYELIEQIGFLISQLPQSQNNKEADEKIASAENNNHFIRIRQDRLCKSLEYENEHLKLAIDWGDPSRLLSLEWHQTSATAGILAQCDVDGVDAQQAHKLMHKIRRQIASLKNSTTKDIKDTKLLKDKRRIFLKNYTTSMQRRTGEIRNSKNGIIALAVK